MNLDAIIQEKTEQFEKITEMMKAKDDQHRSEMTEMQDELLRLQGEYRMLMQLKEQEVVTETSENINAEIIE